MKKLLFGVLGILLAIPGWSATLPSGYTELEYIESSGTQWINTGVAGFNTGNWEIYAKWMLPVETQPSQYVNVFSVYSGENYNSYRVITNLTDSSKYYVSGNSKAGGGSVALSDKAINQIHTATARNGSVIFDGVTVTTSTQGTALPSDASLGMFARGDGSGKIIARIYSFNVKKDGTLIRNFVPAKDSSGVVGMYDTVNNRFFTNTGTGTFVAGPAVSVPSDYTELQWIESSCAAYINTGVKINTLVAPKIVTSFKILRSGDYDYFGDTSNSNPTILYNILPGTNQYVRWGTTTYNRFSGDVSKLQFMDGFHTLEMGGADIKAENPVKVDGAQIAKFAADSNAALRSTNSILFFKARSNCGPSQFARFAIYSNNAPVFNGIPVMRKSDSALGFYDTVTGAFFGNAGSGAFTAGPVVPENPIRIATTAYNTARFSPVVNDLNTTVATIRDVVTNTINQTKAIADLQAKKQTRPGTDCPAGKKCLLVEDNDGVPHWFEIVENIYGLPTGYTPLEYIETTGTQYILLPTIPTASNVNVTVEALHTDGTNEQIFFAPASGIQYLYTVSTGWRVWKSGGSAANIASLGGRHSIKIKTTSSGCEYYVDGQKNTDVPASLFTSAEFSGKTLNLGARTISDGADFFWKGKIYSFQVECNNSICINMFPAKRNSDGAIGMFDTANNLFYTNKGTGTFGKGQEL
jgi:hypothetical protein